MLPVQPNDRMMAPNRLKLTLLSLPDLKALAASPSIADIIVRRRGRRDFVFVIVDGNSGGEFGLFDDSQSSRKQYVSLGQCIQAAISLIGPVPIRLDLEPKFAQTEIAVPGRTSGNVQTPS